MNLHGTVRGAITSVNPDIVASFQASTGNTVDTSGNATPAYAAAVNVRVQPQPISTGRLRHLEALNIQGTFRTLYVYGLSEGVVRINQRGGDLFTFSLVPGAAAQTWLVVEVAEIWPDWANVTVALQS
jgi:hypothetical protein